MLTHKLNPSKMMMTLIVLKFIQNYSRLPDYSMTILIVEYDFCHTLISAYFRPSFLLRILLTI
jgi:hypothetical protein